MEQEQWVSILFTFLVKIQITIYMLRVERSMKTKPTYHTMLVMPMMMFFCFPY